MTTAEQRNEALTADEFREQLDSVICDALAAGVPQSLLRRELVACAFALDGADTEPCGPPDMVEELEGRVA